MADVVGAVRARLMAHTGTAALINTRAYFRLEQDTPLPASTVQRISAVRFPAFGVDADKVLARVQVDAWGTTRASAFALAEQHRSALQRYRGTSGGVAITDTYLDDETDVFEDGVNQWRVRQDYRVWYPE